MKRIKVDQFAILSERAPAGEIGLTINADFKYSLEGKAVGVGMSFELIDKQLSEKIIVLKLFCEFTIMDNDWDSCIKENTLTIPRDALEFFALHTVGTARGIMFCKTEGTAFNNIIIPPINVRKLINGDLTVPLNCE